MTHKLTPARVITPGKILSRELESRGWTQKDLAAIMGRPEQTISAIVNAKKEITPETAIELAEAFDIPAEFWTNLETNYRLHIAKKKHHDQVIARRSRLYAIAPVSELVKRGWLPETQDIDLLENLVCQFLGINSPADTPHLAVNFRHNHALEPKDLNLIAWTKRVEYLASQQTVQEYHPERLAKAIPELLTYTQQSEDISRIPSFLKAHGIYFAVVQHLPKTYVDGATWMINDNPVIAMSLRYDRIDNFWFTLLHELAHVVAGHEGIFIDDLGNLEDNSQENEADQLSCDWLIDPKAFDEFTANHTRYSKKIIQSFAKSQNRHPGIIVGRLQHEEKIGYQNHRQFLVKIRNFFVDI